jgi:hypothetical protein
MLASIMAAAMYSGRRRWCQPGRTAVPMRMIDSLSVMSQSSTDYKVKVAWADCLQGARRDHRILGLDRKARMAW